VEAAGLNDSHSVPGSRYVDSDGLRLHHLDWGGEGRHPIVLVHGSRLHAHVWNDFSRRFRDRYHVIAVDQPGHGESAWCAPDEYRLDALYRDLRAVVEARGLERYTLIGHSLGGRVALRAALLQPSTLTHVTLLDVTPAPGPPGGDTASIVDALTAAPDAGRTRDEFRTWFRRAGLAPEITDWLLLNVVSVGDVYRWRLDRAALAALYPRIGAEDLWPAVEGQRAYGVHVVRGEKSDYVSEDDVLRLQAAGCRVDTVAGAGHFLHVERPRELLDRIVQGLG